MPWELQVGQRIVWKTERALPKEASSQREGQRQMRRMQSHYSLVSDHYVHQMIEICLSLFARPSLSMRYQMSDIVSHSRLTTHASVLSRHQVAVAHSCLAGVYAIHSIASDEPFQQQEYLARRNEKLKASQCTIEGDRKTSNLHIWGGWYDVRENKHLTCMISII